MRLIPIPAQQQVDQLLGPFSKAISSLVLIIPRLIGALIILFIGWIVGRLVARIIRRLADAVGLDRRLLQTPIGEMVGGGEDALSRALGKIGAYYIYFIALLAAANVLNIPLLSQFINGAAAYLPSLIAGVLIIIIGFVVADFVGDVIERSAAPTAGAGTGSLLASGVQVFLYILVIIIGLDTMQVNVEILYIFASAFAGALGLAVAIGVGIAIGLGGKDYVADNIDRWANRASNATGETGSSRRSPESQGSTDGPSD